MEKTNNEPLGFVFLHGAGLGSWIWEDVISKMEYPSLAIDFPGRGNHNNIKTKNLSLNKYVEFVLSDIDQFSPEKLIIVAHSISGNVALEIAHRRQNRIYGFVAISAAIPTKNNSYLSALPVIMNVFLRLMITLSGTQPPKSAIHNGLCSDLNERHRLNVINRYVPESKRLYTDRINTKDISVNSLYIRLKKDKAFSEKNQNKMIKNLQATKIINIDSGHLPMLSKPVELAQILNNFATQIIKS